MRKLIAGIHPMSAEEFSESLQKLDMSRADAVRLLGVGSRAVSRWQRGERGVPGYVAQFLRYLIATNKSGKSAICLLEAKLAD